jgi:hypothetical protein
MRKLAAFTPDLVLSTGVVTIGLGVAARRWGAGGATWLWLQTERFMPGDTGEAELW